MYNLINKYSFFFNLCLVVSMCACIVRPNPIEKLFTPYSNDPKIDFHSGVINHFPKSIKSNQYETYLRYEPMQSDVGFYYLEMGLKVDELSKRINQFDSLSMVKFSPSSVDSLKNPCPTYKNIPIPSFDLGLQSINGVNISKKKDCTIYIIETGTKDLLDLTMKSGGYCSEILNPGYTKGVCVIQKEQMLLYWTILW